MSEAAATAPAHAKKAAKPKKTAKSADHPKYSVMIAAAVSSLKDRGGSSRQAILKYIMANYELGTEVTKVNAHLKSALKAGVKDGILKQAKGTGASGSFRLGEKKSATKPETAKKPKAAKKPAAKKAKSPKKAAAKKPKSPAKKPAKPKKTAKSPTKKAAKPKKAKTPKKAAARKPAKK